jgi:hypothetical protein
MKKVEKLKLSMTMAVCFIVALFATSCSNDDFFGFEDETTNLGLLSSQNNITSRGYIDTLDYLSISSNSTINLTANEIINLHQAINRIELLTDYGRLSRPNSGSSYNMSDTLFTLANKIIANTRSLNLLLANKNERVKDGNREGGGFVISGKDCVGQAIAKRFHLNADSINTLLAGTIPNYYTNGVPLAMMNTAFSACGVSGSLKTTLPLSDLGSYDMLLLDMLNNHIVSIRDNKGKTRLSILVNDILYAVSEDNYVKIFYEQEGQIKKTLIRTTAKNIEDDLEGFITRCHRSYLVNIKRVRFFNNDRDNLYVLLDNENINPIPVSRSYRDIIGNLLSK